jgi:hypothetical protein
MSKINNYISECEFNFKGLEYTATFYSTIYMVCILLPVFLDILIITKVIIKIGFPIFSLLLSIIPFTLSNNISRINSYRDLSLNFKNLKHDFENNSNISLNEEFKKLNLMLGHNNINPIVKYFMNKYGGNK